MSTETLEETRAQKAERILNEIRNFTGTMSYTRVNHLPMVATDGAIYLAETCGCYWLLDLIGSHQVDRKSRARIPDLKFQVWVLEVDHDTKSAVARCGDGNDAMVSMQHIQHTDFPLESIKLYALPHVGGGVVVMLPGEY